MAGSQAEPTAAAPTAAAPTPPAPSPSPQLMQMICGYWMTQALHVTCKLTIPDLIAAGTTRLADLAAATGAAEPALFRLLRFLGALGLLSRGGDGSYSLTALGGCLRTGEPGSMRNLALLSGAEHYRIWGHLEHSVLTGDPALETALGEPLWAYLDSHPEAAARFDNAMADLSRNVHRAAVASFDFGPVKTVVDVGGGTGSLLAHLLTEFPHLHGTLFDQQHVTEQAKPVLAGFGDRADIVAGDFFADDVPADADVYTMSLVLHDFNDEQCGAILRRVRAAMPRHGRLVVLEQLLPEDDTPHIGKLVDVNMLVISGGRERTEREFAALLNAAALRHVQTLPSPTTINAIVAVPA